ncbi:MAG TPA: prepilin-type N-terminal cleavage/methylation domain-containing protein [Candidatus Saccharimonadales bacterium]
MHMVGLRNKQHGFTIVELLVVIVVIAILAVITVVAYNGIQNRAKDSARKSDLASMAKTVALYTVQTGNKLIDASAGCGRHGAGWWTGSYDSNPSVYQCMVDAGFKSVPQYDPVGAQYMKAVCTKDGQQVSYVLTHLQTLPYNSGFIETICDSPQLSGAWNPGIMDWDDSYGMNYGVRIAQ